MSDQELTHVKIRIYEPDSEEFPGCLAENVWAVHLGDGRYRLANNPLHPHLSRRDIIRPRRVSQAGSRWLEFTPSSDPPVEKMQ